MASKTVITMVDDITGEQLPDGEGETIVFAVQGSEYEIDLSRKNAKKLVDTLAFYTGHGRRIGTSRRSPVQRTPVPTAVDTVAVRRWAASRGIPVNTRGRVPAAVIEQFRAAGN